MDKALESPEAIAQRLINLRNAAGLSREDVAKHGIKSPSLRSWEMGHRTIKWRTAEALAAVFNKHGVVCTAEWILRGEGRDPIAIASQFTDEAYILKEIYRFESTYANSIVAQVEDHCMSPWLNKGDFVGGIFLDFEDKEKFVNQVCIVRTKEFGTQIRNVQQTNDAHLYNLVSYSNRGNILNVELEAVAMIVFVRRCLDVVMERSLKNQ